MAIIRLWQIMREGRCVDSLQSWLWLVTEGFLLLLLFHLKMKTRDQIETSLKMKNKQNLFKTLIKTLEVFRWQNISQIPATFINLQMIGKP